MPEPIQIADPGLQPERTVFAWSRTLVSFLVVSAVFLRWLPHFGVGIVLMIAISATMALGIFASQRARYRRMAQGVKSERVSPDIVAVLMTTLVLIAIGVFGIILVLGPN
ncbi:DUF202 domain-containing protein [Glutamicibacter arilaitensis]|uniref:DUF202 domain-containing protein n=1 Tax=Glutamicibacter arilaitensis TaxID=256701 RepID=UPI00384E0AFA